jgi:3-dehydroquinate synthase
MEGLRLPDITTALTIKSHRGSYGVQFIKDLNEAVSHFPSDKNFTFIVDKKVHSLYRNEIETLINNRRFLLVEATEKNKNLAKIPEYIQSLMEQGTKRGHVLVAIGGGIIQDITCFLASTLFRGMDWYFLPTTLLAQADSCIGSKSSINVGDWKNIVGTFVPPNRIFVCTEFLKTLSQEDVHSGVGEMIKVHMIKSWERFLDIKRDYVEILKSDELMKNYILRSLLIKRDIIEVDEFDKGIRNILNYGHSFGHAIESATDFEVPHGVAVTIGMDMANFISSRFGFWPKEKFTLARELLKVNSGRYFSIKIPDERFFTSISKDKKNIDENLALILPRAEGGVAKMLLKNDDHFRSACIDYFRMNAS